MNFYILLWGSVILSVAGSVRKDLENKHAIPIFVGAFMLFVIALAVWFAPEARLR